MDEIHRPELTFLPHAGRMRILDASLVVLDEIGMQILSEQARSLLAAAGCPADAQQVVRIPERVVRAAVARAPRSIPVFDRLGRPAMDLGGKRAYFGTGSDLVFSHDAASGARRRCVLDDVARAARVADALGNLDFVMSFAHPGDIPPGLAYLASFKAMLENTTKPLVTTAAGHDDLAAMCDMAAAVRGGDRALRERPWILHYAEPVSPLRHPAPGLDKLLLCAERGVPVVYSPAPIAGSSAPITVAGHVALGLAESLCGLVIHQLRAPGAPFLPGMGAAVMDMATGQCSYNAPEYYLAYMGMIEMAHHLELPCWGYAGTSDSQLPDGQAALESAVENLLSTFAGANLNHDVGYLNFGLTGSLEMLVVNDELIGQMRRLARGIPVDDASLALDAIRAAGHGGSFLRQRHTIRNVRKVQWRPGLLGRTSYDNWKAQGGLDLLGRASDRLDRILREHQVESLEEEQAKAIEKRYEEFVAACGP